MFEAGMRFNDRRSVDSGNLVILSFCALGVYCIGWIGSLAMDMSKVVRWR